MINVLIVEDQKLVKETMEHDICASGRYVVVSSITNAALAIDVCSEKQIDLIIMDICTENDESGLIWAKRIKELYPHIKIIIVTSLIECGFIERAKLAKAESFWYKDASVEELLKVMDKTMNGESIYPDNTPSVMIGSAESHEFTKMEIEVLRGIVDGKSYKEIAETLYISPETVKKHISNMLQKTGFDSKTKLAVAVAKKNLIINGF